MDPIPIDTSHPGVQDYLALIRLQVLTPLSLLISVAVISVCTILTQPTLKQVFRQHPTSISPHPSIIAIYALVTYIGQIGYCILLVFARKSETKRILTKATGFSLVFANWIVPLWALSFVFQWFLLATVFQVLLLLVLVYSNVVLLVYHPPSSDRPLDTALIHAPLRFFLALPLNVLFTYSLFLTLGMWFKPAEPGTPVHYSAWHAWAGFVAVFSTNLLATLVIFLRQDVVWCVAATWLCISLWAETPKPSPVFVTVIAFTVVHPLAIFASLAHAYIQSRQTRIALPPGEDPLHRNMRRNPPIGEGQTAQEVNPEQVWV